MDMITYALLKKYVETSLEGAGALKGKDGKSAYEIAVEHGYAGTEEEWVDSLQGESVESLSLEDLQIILEEES